MTSGGRRRPRACTRLNAWDTALSLVPGQEVDKLLGCAATGGELLVADGVVGGCSLGKVDV